MQLTSFLKKSIYASICLIGCTINVNANIAIQEPVIKSYVGQPLKISIPVTADTSDWETLWGTVETSTGEPLNTKWERPYTPGNIGYIEIQTSNIINNPIIELVVRVESMKNKIIQNYSILLDPTIDKNQMTQGNIKITSDENVVASTSNIKITSDENIVAPTSNIKITSDENIVAPTSNIKIASDENIVAPTSNIKITSDEKSKVTTPTSVNAEEPLHDTKIIVKSGDTLYKIAKKYNIHNQNITTFMNDIFKNNRTAFGKNINVLYAGKTLKIMY